MTLSKPEMCIGMTFGIFDAAKNIRLLASEGKKKAEAIVRHSILKDVVARTSGWGMLTRPNESETCGPCPSPDSTRVERLVLLGRRGPNLLD